MYTCSDYIFYFVLIDLINNYKIVCIMVFENCLYYGFYKNSLYNGFSHELLVCDGFLMRIVSIRWFLYVDCFL